MAFQIRLGTTSAIATNGSGTEGTNMVTVPISSTYKTTASTLVDSSRNSDGFIVSNVVRAGIRKVEISFRVLTIADYSKLAKFFNTYFDFYALYFDQDNNAWETRHFYVGNRVADALQNKQWVEDNGYNDHRYKPEYVENVKLSLIEV